MAGPMSFIQLSTLYQRCSSMHVEDIVSLQGIKRGIVEVSDVIVVNKADGDLLPAARRIAADYLSAVKLSRSKSSHWRTKVS